MKTGLMSDLSLFLEPDSGKERSSVSELVPIYLAVGGGNNSLNGKDVVYLSYLEKSDGRDARPSHSVWDPDSLYLYM